jgi:hypothetical protein
MVPAKGFSMARNEMAWNDTNLLILDAHSWSGSVIPQMNGGLPSIISEKVIYSVGLGGLARIPRRAKSI